MQDYYGRPSRQVSAFIVAVCGVAGLLLLIGARIARLLG